MDRADVERGADERVHERRLADARVAGQHRDAVVEDGAELVEPRARARRGADDTSAERDEVGELGPGAVGAVEVALVEHDDDLDRRVAHGDPHAIDEASARAGEHRRHHDEPVDVRRDGRQAARAGAGIGALARGDRVTRGGSTVASMLTRSPMTGVAGRAAVGNGPVQRSSGRGP
ncbi:MAG: hypothetical protein U1F43_19980 [Myxococcota bacterium]